MHAITCGANFLPVFQFCFAEQEVCRLIKSRDSPSESKKVSPCVRRLRRSVSHFFSPSGVCSVTKAKKIIWTTSAIIAAKNAGYLIAEAPEEGHEHQCGAGEGEQPIFVHHNSSLLTSDAPA